MRAPLWDVYNTKLDGEVSLGELADRTLLSTHFRKFVYEDKDAEKKYFKEIEKAVVNSVPSINKEIGERQIVLTLPDIKFTDAFDEEAPEKNEKTATYFSADGLVAYVPEDVCENVEELLGRRVTVIFGEDNAVALVILSDESVNDQFLTEYDASSATATKFVVGDKTYKFADKAEVYVNTLRKTYYRVDNDDNETVVNADEALAKVYESLKIQPVKNVYEDYNKVIKANVVLNGKGKVTRLDLYVSGTYADFNTVEAIVTKVRNEKITLQYVDGDNINATFTYDYSDIDEDDLPRVLKDNKTATLDDIAVNDVLTYYHNGDVKEPETIYISSNPVTGEVTKAKKVDMKLYVDSTAYVPSMNLLLVTDEDPEDVTLATDADDLVGEEVTLYTNIYGEYVMAVTDTVASDWTFAYLTRVYDVEDDQEDDDKSYFKVRLLMSDGSSSRAYTVYCDDQDDYDQLKDLHTDLTTNAFVAFKSDSNNEIKFDDICTITFDDTTATVEGGNKTALEKDYNFIVAKEGNDVNDDRQRITGNDSKTYKYVSVSVIFNTNATSTESADVIKRWKSLVKNDKVTADLLLVVENTDNNTTIDYVVADLSNDRIGTSDALYAIVDQDAYKVSEGGDIVRYVDLLTEDGIEAIKAYNSSVNLDVDEDSFVEYILKSDKINTIKELVDVKNFKKLDEDDNVKDEVGEGEDTILAYAKNATMALEGKVHPTTVANSDYNALFADAQGSYYMQIVEGIFPTTGDAITVIQENEALHEAYPTEPAFDDNIKEKEYTADELADGYAVLVKPSKDVKITVKVDGKVYSTYTINAQKLELVSADETIATADKLKTSTIVKANYKVVDTEDLLIKYEDEESDVNFTFGELEIDEDVLIYDLRDGFDTMSFSDFAKEVDAEKYLYVVAYRNSDCDKDADANVLVIIE